MREFIFSKDVGFFRGLPWKLATWYGQMSAHEGSYDICAVIRHSIQGFLATLVIIMLASMAMLPVAQLITWVTFMLLNNGWIFPNYALVFLWFCVALIGGVILFAYCCVKIKEFTSRVERNIEKGSSSNGVAEAVYMAIK